MWPPLQQARALPDDHVSRGAMPGVSRCALQVGAGVGDIYGEPEGPHPNVVGLQYPTLGVVVIALGALGILLDLRPDPFPPALVGEIASRFPGGGS